MKTMKFATPERFFEEYYEEHPTARRISFAEFVSNLSVAPARGRNIYTSYRKQARNQLKAYYEMYYSEHPYARQIPFAEFVSNLSVVPSRGRNIYTSFRKFMRETMFAIPINDAMVSVKAFTPSTQKPDAIIHNNIMNTVQAALIKVDVFMAAELKAVATTYNLPYVAFKNAFNTGSFLERKTKGNLLLRNTFSKIQNFASETITAEEAYATLTATIDALKTNGFYSYLDRSITVDRMVESYCSEQKTTVLQKEFLRTIFKKAFKFGGYGLLHTAANNNVAGIKKEIEKYVADTSATTMSFISEQELTGCKSFFGFIPDAVVKTGKGIVLIENVRTNPLTKSKLTNMLKADMQRFGEPLIGVLQLDINDAGAISASKYFTA